MKRAPYFIDLVNWVFYYIYIPNSTHNKNPLLISISNTSSCNTLLIGVQQKILYIYICIYTWFYIYIFLCLPDVYYYLKDPPPEFLPRFGTITMAGLLGMFLARKGNRIWCNHKQAGFTLSAALGSESLFKFASSLWVSWRSFRSLSLHLFFNNSLYLMNPVIWSKQLSIHF